MSNPELTNLHILNYFNARIPDVANLDRLLRNQRYESSQIQSKRKLAFLSSKKRTSSYMRYKIPRPQKRRKLKLNRSSAGKETQLYCRHQRRNRCLLNRLHSIHELEAIKYPVDSSRKAVPKWLETHLWHKKRFFTKLCWGYCLPTHHQARGKRFLHSAIQDATVIHDNSYIRPLQIIGLQENIQQLLRHFTDPSTDFLEKSLDQKKNSSSSNTRNCGLLREVPILLYRQDKFPMECLGPATLCVIPSTLDEASFAMNDIGMKKVQTKIWLWCHPAIFQEAFDEFTAVNENELDLDIGCVPGGLLRFNVRGRQSLSTLNKVLKTVTSAMSDETETKISKNKVTGDHSRLEMNSNKTFGNENFFTRLMSYQQVSRIWLENAILGIKVKDVRLLTAFYNKDNTDVIVSKDNDIKNPSGNSFQTEKDTDDNIKKDQLLWPKGASSSSLWNDEERLQSSKEFIRDHDLNKGLFDLRQNSSQMLTKSDDNENFLVNPQNNSEVKEKGTINGMPVFIVRKDLKNFSSERLLKSKKKSPFLGFDIILPSNWGAAVWKAFQFANARAIGLNELESIHLDHGMASFPRDYPDTKAGREYWSEKERNLETVDSRRPPKKRLGRLGLQVPKWKNILWTENNTEEINDNEDIVCDVDAPSNTSMQLDETIIRKSTYDSAEMNKNGLITYLDFIVAREEKYVQSFRIPSLIQNHQASQKDIYFAYQYAIRDNEINSNKKNHNNTKSNDNNNDIITQQNKQNHELFISLMESFVQQCAPSLSCQSMLSVLLVPCGRGISKDGAEILQPSESDYHNFIYYHGKRSELSMSSTRQANKRMGEWRGANMNTAVDVSLKQSHKSKKMKKNSPEILDNEKKMMESENFDLNLEESENLDNEGRRIIGYVTSGRYKGSPSGALSIGLCDAASLIDMQKSAAKIILHYDINSDQFCSGKILNLVMFRSPLSKWLRPALIDIISVLH